MNWLIKSATIIDPAGPHHNQTKDILISEGKIEKIDDHIETNAEVFEAENLHVSAGWLDLRVNFCDPGFEHKEDICSGLQAARKGGFTGVCLVPSTDPPLSTKSQIEYVQNKARGAVTDLFPYGTISAQRKGEQLSEMYDMSLAGALAFTDDKRPVSSAALFSTALLYSCNFNGRIVSFPHEKTLAEGGQIHEGNISTFLGLKGLSALSEELMVTRDLALCEYNQAAVHFTGISSKGSVEMIRQAKKKGLPVTCDVYAHNLLLTDESLSDYDQNKKVLPPLRDETHRLALIEGLKDGTIDAICSDHSPEDVERKNVEFEHAAFGMIGLETCFAVSRTALSEKLDLAEMISKLTTEPRKIIGQQVAAVDTGSLANLTFFNPDLKWTFEKSDIRSKSANTPFIGNEFIGKPLAVFNHGRLEKC